MPKVIRPALRYHGGKFRIAPWVIGHFPPHQGYVEPFGGGASVLLRKQRVGVECYNDLDGAVVDFFRVLRDPQSARELQRRAALTPFSREEFNWSYQPPSDAIDAAHKLLVRSFFGHGSDSATRSCRTGFRAKPTERRSTPAVEWSTWHANVPALCERLQGVVIEQRDAVEVMQRFDSPTTLHYVDPPYVLSSRTAWRTNSAKQYRHELGDDDHRRLASALRSLSGMVVLSGYPSTLYDELYAGWQRLEKRVAADMGASRVECLWLSPSAQAARGFTQGVLWPHAEAAA